LVHVRRPPGRIDPDLLPDVLRSRRQERYRLLRYEGVRLRVGYAVGKQLTELRLVLGTRVERHEPHGVVLVLRSLGDDPERLHPGALVVREVDGCPTALEVDHPPGGGGNKIDLLPPQQRGDLCAALVPDVDQALVPVEDPERAFDVEGIEPVHGYAVGDERELEVRQRLRVHGAPPWEGGGVEEVLPRSGWF